MAQSTLLPMHILTAFALLSKVTQRTCPACTSYTETLQLKPGPISRPKCPSTSPTSTLSSTSHISPGERLAQVLLLHGSAVVVSQPPHPPPPMRGPRYWLWYTTQRIVCGSVRRVYQKLKQFKVQFLVLQLKTDPSQVILQCLPSNKVGSS